MNPYDFVRIDWDTPAPRHAAPAGDRFTGLSGRFQGTITTLTPFFLPDKQKREPQRCLRNQQGQAIIPGSSLKGLFRSVVETVGGCAFWFADLRDLPKDSLPNTFRPPTKRNRLDAACRLFGYLGQARDDTSNVLAGRVTFDDAICDEPRERDAIYTCILATPKPRHHAWYLDHRGRVTGRKFYFHANSLQTVTTRKARGGITNPHIQPLEAENVFTFQASFTNVTPDDLNLFLYALVLEPEMRHKLGYAKPAGLGSVQVQLSWLEYIDYSTRYRTREGGITRYEGQDLETEINQRIALYTQNHTSMTLDDLRRIWHWPPHPGVTYRYPDQDWFDDHPNTPIDQTP